MKNLDMYYKISYYFSKKEPDSNYSIRITRELRDLFATATGGKRKTSEVLRDLMIRYIADRVESLPDEFKEKLENSKNKY